jgi:hypothetical protein
MDREASSKVEYAKTEGTSSALIATALPMEYASNDLPKKQWERAIYNCEQPTCCAYFFCPQISVFAFLPHHGAAMARRIGWNGFAVVGDSNKYQTNRKWIFNILCVCCPVFVLYCILLLVYWDGCLSTIKDPSEWFCTSYSGVLFGLLCTAFALFMGGCLFVSFFVLLRFNMRKSLGIKASYFKCCGNVGEFLEDVFSMVLLAPCAMGQMEVEVCTPMEGFCAGSDPGTLDLGRVV